MQFQYPKSIIQCAKIRVFKTHKNKYFLKFIMIIFLIIIYYTVIRTGWNDKIVALEKDVDKISEDIKPFVNCLNP